MQDFEHHLVDGKMDLRCVYYVMRALAACNMLQDDITKGLVDLLVRRGYDAGDYLELSDGDLSGFRRGIHMMMLICQSAPDLKNKDFRTHAQIFA